MTEAPTTNLSKVLEAFGRIPECAASLEAGHRDALSHVDVVFRIGGRDVRREADVLFRELFYWARAVRLAGLARELASDVSANDSPSNRLTTADLEAMEARASVAELPETFRGVVSALAVEARAAWAERDALRVQLDDLFAAIQRANESHALAAKLRAESVTP